MRPTVKLEGLDNTAKTLSALKSLEDFAVYVGIPEKAAHRNKAGITNPQLAFVHTHGVRSVDTRRMMGAMMINRGLTYSQAHALMLHTRGSVRMAIPARPIIEPAIEAKDNQRSINNHLKLAAEAALAGNRAGTLRALRMAGMDAQNRVRAWFTDPRNHWAPNAPSTIKRKGSSRPLIDTSQLRRSIIYVVAEK